jgi:hypothetical protein
MKHTNAVTHKRQTLLAFISNNSLAEQRKRKRQAPGLGWNRRSFNENSRAYQLLYIFAIFGLPSVIFKI